ncbi:MAG: hypothetical protein CVV64_05125 [Candidatus Wallbacteria bacterium HGW-Wallbacteria-1]|jgi:23S rRNA (adenine2503-C2)-methyltransferase|uniref:Probable dual-specificity RNA methyltransferase RlmN n=1 Tax=Candidatus Wallbacteria bacterium HGW-Wallbacteria-1 TaxID=2013854 RepID=A0A2N1PSA3_9BACT|nr:MAG: hypothetical protein CVV64_05125 [Candidatus Wallbacteria bacterium HGW-Wallbacteria-1]
MDIPGNVVELKSLTEETMERHILSLGGKKFSHKQILKWIYHRDSRDIDSWTDISRALRQKIMETSTILTLKPEKVTVSSTGTRKYKFRLHDGNCIESVLIPDGKRLTACLSTQVGCRMACGFCATGKAGLLRNLSAAEIIEQLMAMTRHVIENPPEPETFAIAQSMGRGARYLDSDHTDSAIAKDSFIDDDIDGSVDISESNENGANEPADETEPGYERKISHIVIMGMGEPFDNADSLGDAIAMMKSIFGLQYASRRITVSTCGHVRGMDRFAGRGIDLLLAVSVGSPFDDERASIMPVGRKWSISELLDAIRRFPHPPREKVTFEYTLIKDFNDSPDHARALGKMARSVKGKINLIRMNPHPGSSHLPPSEERIEAFQSILLQMRIVTTLRKSLGQDIAAACGMLGLEDVLNFRDGKKTNG